MTLPLFSPGFTDNSALTGFAGNRLERLSEKRGPDSLRDALADPRARVMLAGSGRALLPRANGTASDPWLAPDLAESLGAEMAGAVLLGFAEDGSPRLAAPFGTDPDNPPEGFLFPDLRSIYMRGLLGEADTGALAQAGALLSWHSTHRFCARCGAESVLADGGAKRVCTGCATKHFPRTDPVVIMLVIAPDNDRVLLGRSPHFPERMYSCLAGFVEPGETLENAVRRETFEETGVVAGPVGYFASQPWPFPHSLMIGMHAIATSAQITLDNELEDARWFSRAEVAAALSGADDAAFRMPPKGAIAWRLVEAWFRA